ncbi:MAG: hypothetical protein GX806_00475, partial [Lentisphaerae bacterium]|nr:hypothetical protein [Lentisphaerota bacterium]
MSLSLVLVFSGWQVAWSQAQNDEFEALPLTDMQPPQAQPAIAAPAAEPAEPGSEVAPPSADALFELDRSSLFTVEDQSPVPAPSPAAAPRASFWGRLFGKGRAPQPSAPVAAELTAESSADAPEVLLSAEEIVRRQAQEIEGQRILEQADQARDQKDFEEALKLYNQALNLLPVRPPTMDKRNQARSSQAYCEYRIALLHYQQGNWSETKKAINRALGYAPKHRESLRLSERLAREEAQKLVAKPPPIRATPERLNKEKRIREAISRGKQYMDIKEYEKAAYEFNTVIFEDKNNEEANANLRKIAEKGYKLETQQYERMKKEMMTQVRDAWTPALRPEVVAPERAPDATIMV